MAATHVYFEKFDSRRKNSDRLREKNFPFAKSEFGPRVGRQYSVFTPISYVGCPELTDT